MKTKLILADSGGTTTDWCIIKEDNKTSFFTTKSYHPSNFSEQFFNKMLEDWGFRSIDFNAKMIFYGAGCSSLDVQKSLNVHFKEVGFKHIQIETDAYGACRAMFGNDKGKLAVLGTGSVVCSFNGKIIEKVYGGLGYLLGDEGSGFFFGKLVIMQLLSGQFSGEIGTILHAILGERKQILAAVYSQYGKDFMSQIPKKIGDLTYNPELVALHTYNFNLFIDRCLGQISDLPKRIQIVGSYAHYHKEILEECLLKSGWEVQGITKQPIKRLAEYHLNE